MRTDRFTHTCTSISHKECNGANNQLWPSTVQCNYFLLLGYGCRGRAERLEISDKSIGELLIKDEACLVNSVFNDYLKRTL